VGVISLTPVIAEDVGGLFTSDIVGNNSTSIGEDIVANDINLSNDTTESNEISLNESSNNSIAINNTTNDTSDNYTQFKKEWNDFISTTSYERYSGHQKTYNEMENDKSFNCYDGAYYTIYLATKYGLKSELVHGFWEGVGHGAVRVYLPDGTSEMFDTTQYQKGYGRNGLEGSIYWDKIDQWSTKEAKKKADKILGSGFTTPVEIIHESLNIDNKNDNDFNIDLSVDLATDLSFEL
jgi:hypothetical protein